MTETAAHSPQYEELAALHALDVLEGEELADYEAHLATCPTCRGLVAANREVAQQLAVLAPESEMEPSPGFKARLLDRARQELEGEAAARRDVPRVREPARARWWSLDWLFGGRQPWAIPVAAGVLAIVVLALVIGVPAYQNQVVATVALNGTANGSARVLVRRSGAASLELQGVGAPPGGHVYEAWVIGSDGRPVPAGVLDTGQGSLALTTRVPSNSVVAVTVEPEPGREQPSSQPILAGRVTV